MTFPRAGQLAGLLPRSIPDLQAWPTAMDGQVRQALAAGDEAAGRTAGQPDDIAVSKNLLSVGRTGDAATGDDDEYDVEVRLGMGVHTMTGR